ncbi:MAG: hypothetical protein HY763_02130 [Planctomycetes bacterium]|nr:hypothetical protein [Planctomycetota bacterium]
MSLVLVVLAILVASAALALSLGRAPRPAATVALAGGALASGLVIAAAASGFVSPADAAARSVAWGMPLGTARLATDGLSDWFLLSIGLVGLPVCLYSWGYLRDPGAHGQAPVFAALLCLLLAFLVVLVCADDAVVFLVAWEAMTLCAFLLVGFHDRRPEARRGAWMYLVATHLGTALFLVPMFVYLAGRAGTTSFAGLRGICATLGPAESAVVFVLGLLGFGTKAGFVPMHVWLPAAHPVAPTPISALLSGIVVKTGIYGLLRLLTWLPAPHPLCAVLVLLVGTGSGVLGVLYAVAQHDLKRLLAYHSVENIGIIGLAIGVGMLGQATGHMPVAALGYAGALLHVLNHALFKALLFLSAGAIVRHAGTGQIDRLGGLARTAPWNAFCFLLGAVAICGLPPLNGFVSEWLIFGALLSGTFHSAGAIAAAQVVGLVGLSLMGALALACFAKVFAVVFLGEPREAGLPRETIPGAMTAAMVMLAVPCVVIGLLPGVVLPLTLGGVRALVPGLSRAVQSPLAEVLAPAGWISGVAVVLLGVTVLLVMLRRRLRRSDVSSAPAPTWGCGYAFPTARMQYTASSFAWDLVTDFRRVLWPERRWAPVSEAFPRPAALESHTPDLAELELLAPLFRGVARAAAIVRTLTWSGDPVAAAVLESSEGTCAPGPHAGVSLVARGMELPGGRARIGLLRHVVRASLHALRRGSIHVRLAYLAATLIVLFAIEAAVSPRPAPRRAPSPARGIAPNEVQR